MSCCETPASAAINGSSTHDDVKEYYGKRVKATDDLQTGACQLGGPTMGPHVRDAIKQVHEDVKNKYYGCGLIIPDNLDGASVLDLGSGAGLDCFVLSKLVGENGRVTGLDMTDEQLEVANKHIDYHTQKFGYKAANVDFVKGYIEKLSAAGIKENFYDIIVSNCVVNLSPDKRSVLAEAYKALKEGGELYFSDIYADQRVPENIQKHKVLWGECISGALYWQDLHTIATEVGFSDPRVVTANLFDVVKPELIEVLGDLKFVSVTYRLFKLPSGTQPPSGVEYDGNIQYCPDQFVLDHRNVFKTGDPVEVNSEVATIIKNSRFSNFFEMQNVPKDHPKESHVNPFEFVKKGGGGSGGCCGPAGKAGGCC